jgi:hypothetical protein
MIMIGGWGYTNQKPITIMEIEGPKIEVSGGGSSAR